MFLAIILSFIFVLAPSRVMSANKFPPFYIYKVASEQSFVKYWFNDVVGKLWSSQQGRTRLFITGKWRVRFDIKKWVVFLNGKHLQNIDIIWIFNPSGTKLVDHYKWIQKRLIDFAMSVPAVVDSHSFIGRALKIDYDIPTIIGVTKNNKLAFVYAAPLNGQSAEEISSLIRLKLK